MEPDYYNLAIILVGISILGVTWLPNLLKDKPLSYPILYVISGFLLFRLPLNLPSPLPHLNSTFVVHLTEFCVIVSLTGVGLKIDHPLKWKSWKHMFQLLVVTMVLCIALFTGLSYWYAGFSLSASVLLAAVLSPTDPVLAADVQVGPPNEKKEKRDKFMLTAEAGFNDGLAFPFVYLAISLAGVDGSYQMVLENWLLEDLFLKIAIAVAAGGVLGWMLRTVFMVFMKLELTNVSDGFVSLALTLLVYGITEIVGGYGFLAVFISALLFSRKGQHQQLKKELHNFTDQFERLLIVVILLLFGAAISAGLYEHLSVQGIVMGVVFIFVIRPIAGWLSLWRAKLNIREKLVVSFFGIRGIGSLYYLSFAISYGTFNQDNVYEIWAVVAFTMVLSIIIHGMLAYPATKWAQAGREEYAAAR